MTLPAVFLNCNIVNLKKLCSKSEVRFNFIMSIKKAVDMEKRMML